MRSCTCDPEREEEGTELHETGRGERVLLGAPPTNASSGGSGNKQLAHPLLPFPPPPKKKHLHPPRRNRS